MKRRVVQKWIKDPTSGLAGLSLGAVAAGALYYFFPDIHWTVCLLVGFVVFCMWNVV